MKRIILDTDIGTDVDDALALALAVASPELIIEGVTTVHADAPLRARIARRLLALAGRTDVLVTPGASLPLASPLPSTFHWHPRLWGHEGQGLLEAADLAPTEDLAADADWAARFIVERAAVYPGDLSLITIGPLTNIARALRLEPRLADWIRDVTVMGGMVAPERVPWPPVLETNLNADPAAAEIVFASRLPLTLVPFEVTTQVFLTPEQRASLRHERRPLLDALVLLMERMLERFASFSADMALPVDPFAESRTYMHDPLAVYAAMDKRHVTLQEQHVRLEVRGDVLRTISYPDRSPTMRVCVAVDAAAFVSLWLDRVRNLTLSSRFESTEKPI